MPEDRRTPAHRERPPAVMRAASVSDPLGTATRLAAAMDHRMATPLLLSSALDAIQEALDAPRTAVFLRDASGVACFRDGRGVSPVMAEAMERIAPWPPDATDAGPVVRDLRGDDALAALRDAGRLEDVEKGLFLPLRIDERLFGRVDVYLGRSRMLSADERASVEAITHLLALALARNREEAGRRLLAKASEVLGASLDPDTTLAAVAQLVIEELADGCVIHLLTASGTLERVVAVEREVARATLIRRIGRHHAAHMDDPHGPGRAIRSGVPEVHADVRDELLASVAVDDEHLQLLRALGVRWAMCVPMAARGRTIGAITLLGHEGGAGFDELDQQIVVALTRHAALAVDNARLYRAELEARQVAEAAVRRTERMRELSEALSAARTPGEVAERVLAQALAGLDAIGGALGLRTRNGASQEIVAAVGYEMEEVDRARRFGLDSDFPLAVAMRTGEPLFGVAAPSLGLPAIDDPRTMEPETWVAVPMALEGVIIGSIGLTFRPGRRLDAGDWEFLHVLTRYGAQAVERARLHAAEQRSRADAEAAQRRLLYLAEANALFASSMDYESRLQQLARLAVESVADYCLLYLGDEMGVLHHASAHIDPAREGLVRRVAAAYQPGPGNARGLLTRVLRTRRPLLVRELPPDFAERVSRNPETRAAVQHLGACSAMVVPLIVRGHVIGGAVFLSARPDRLYGPADLAFAEELVRRAAMSVDNARLYRAALDANQSKANFLAVMSHELRTPLTAILGYAELLADGIVGDVNAQQRDQLLRIRASGAHLLSLIEEILSFSRLEAGQEAVRVEPTELGTLVEGTRVLIEPLIARKKLRYEVSLPSGPTVVSTDASKVRQILVNLLANAVKFTDSGTVGLVVRMDGTDVVFSVSDTGIGIPADHLEHIFEPFWQVEQSMTRRVSGTGLGLSVARQLTDMLGGEIDVRSTLGEGSTFTVRLPVRRADRG